jgi:hypothetical protein
MNVRADTNPHQKLQKCRKINHFPIFAMLLANICRYFLMRIGHLTEPIRGCVALIPLFTIVEADAGNIAEKCGKLAISLHLAGTRIDRTGYTPNWLP